MTPAASGEQVVRQPRRTDAIGATLREGIGCPPAITAEMQRLLERLDRVRSNR